MKTRSIAWMGAVLLAALFAAAQKDQPAEVLLKAAQHKELVEGDLKAAIEQYKKVLASAGANRAVAAKALVRIGQCYEKLGRPEARQTYERILREYPEQAGAAAAARALLRELGPAGAASGEAVLVTRRVSGGAPNFRPGGVSPDGRCLCYANEATGDLGILDLTTGKRRLLTSNSSPTTERSESCRFSLDGRQVAYVWLNPHRFCELRLIGLDGSRPRVLYRNPEVFSIGVWGWSPDGGRLLAGFGSRSGTAQLVLVSQVDGAVRTLKNVGQTVVDTAVFSPDGRYVAYDSRAQEGLPPRDVFLLPADGGQEVRLVGHPADDSLLGWSPDGKWILFASDRAGTVDAWAVPVSGGQPQGPPFLVKKDIGKIQPLGFSQKGTYHYGRYTGMDDVHVAAIDPKTGSLTSRPASVAQRFVGSNVSPDWSPDGGLLAYLSQSGIFGSRAEPVIVIKAVDTGQERELVPRLAGLDFLRWSPDGLSLLVVANYGARSALYWVNPQANRFDLITARGDVPWRFLTPALSPDGTTLFYKLREWTAEPSRLMAYDLRTKQERELVSSFHWFSLSPDGRWLAYTMYESAPRAQVVKLMPAGGGPALELYRQPRPGRIVSLTWTPDGGYLLFAKGGQLWRLPVRGGEPEKLDLAMDGLRDLRVHPDGRRLAFTAGVSRQEVWVMENFLPDREGAGR